MSLKMRSEPAFYRQPLTADECPDAEGWYSIRIADGTPNGDTNTLVATVYSEGHATILAAAPEMRELLALAVKVLDAQGIVYGDTGDDTEPLDVLRVASALLARIDGVES